MCVFCFVGFVVVVCLGEFSMFCFLFWIGGRGGDFHKINKGKFSSSSR